MTQLFLTIYDFFQRAETGFLVDVPGYLIAVSFGASQIKLEEDITKFFPDDERVERLNYVFKNSKFVERLVIMVSARDSMSS